MSVFASEFNFAKTLFHRQFKIKNSCFRHVGNKKFKTIESLENPKIYA